MNTLNDKDGFQFPKIFLNQNKTKATILKNTKDFENVQINMDTINPYTAYGAGQYIISGVRQISTTPDFESFENSVKKCQSNESVLECYNRRALEGAVNKCHCLPGSLKVVSPTQQVLVEDLNNDVNCLY